MHEASYGVFYLVSNAGPVVLSVLLILLAFSVLSWAIIFFKFGAVTRSMKESKAFLDTFFETGNADRAFSASEAYRNGTLPRLFRAAYLECRGLSEGGTKPSAARISRAMKREANLEAKRLSSLVPFLATVGNTAPFIGLFGTVWGIMNAFQNIGLSQSASLAAVAPGISEALVATAAGLAAAIPAVMGFNYLSQQIGVIEHDIEEFGPEFVATCLENLS